MRSETGKARKQRSGGAGDIKARINQSTDVSVQSVFLGKETFRSFRCEASSRGHPRACACEMCGREESSESVDANVGSYKRQSLGDDPKGRIMCGRL